jgi:hypothetical protein
MPDKGMTDMLDERDNHTLRLLREQMAALRTDMANVKDDITVLTGITLRIDGTINREFRGIGQRLGQLAERISKLESAQP